MPDDKQKAERKQEEKRRFEAVKAEMSRYIEWKKNQDRKMAEEKAAQSQQTAQNAFVEKKKKDSWVNRVINRAQTGTEKGRMKE